MPAAQAGLGCNTQRREACVIIEELREERRTRWYAAKRLQSVAGETFLLSFYSEHPDDPGLVACDDDLGVGGDGKRRYTSIGDTEPPQQFCR
jgi:hypothetical protein